MAAVQFNTQQLADVRDLLSGIKGGAEKAVRLALNRASSSTLSRVTKSVAQHITPLQSEIKKSMTRYAASSASLTARLEITGAPIPLYDFDWSYYGEVFPNKRRRVSVKVRKDRPREQWRHVFLARMPTGHVGFFERRGRAGSPRLPIEERFGPSVPNVFLFAPGIEPDALNYAGERLAIELDSASRYLLSQQAASLPNA